MLLARFGNITVEAGRGLELSVVAAVVVGGVNVFGGSGTVTGAMLGAIMIGTLEQSLLPARHQRVLARRGARAADPAGGRERRRDPAAPAPLWARTEMKLVTPRAERAGAAPAMSALAGLKRWETLLLALLIAIVGAQQRSIRHIILGVGNFVNLFQLSIEKSIVALMMTLVIIGGEIDLSVASVMGLAACVMAWTFHEGAPLPIAISLALASPALLAGLNNAFWIA